MSLIHNRIPPDAIGPLILAFVGTALYLFNARQKNSKNAKDQSSGSAESSEKPKDIFETTRNSKPFWGGVSGNKGNTSKDKPFGSSYYYAHNGLGNTGGYKDGLRTEDYVMNAPRLLSRGGKSMDEDDADPGKEENGDISRSEELDDKPAVPSTNNLEAEKDSNSGPVTLVPPPLPINRYLWDDPGNLDGIARIYIDTLPPSLKWEGAGITKSGIEAKMLGDDGRELLVTIFPKDGSSADKRGYKLHVPKMYGAATEVKILVKAKRLVLRISKKKDRKNFWNKTNVRGWPSLSATSISPGGGSAPGSGGVDYVDEDLFRNGT